ncbi:DUF1772 domain-containing protein [Bradyrhizobium jicamae]|uniref:DUF1772 domain-containing protein n=1 Tax=Bradyrhizobium jicamae TaxID=280332 RepID=A0ABS5FXH0_9BRAD|nr:DUF1772 domain-containing protein [Bradyrhizobium jicamae]
MPLFLGTTLACLRWQERGAIAVICGGALYVAGMFVVTVGFNVQLNDQLAAADTATGAATPVCARYLTEWTFWNHVRTIASTAAAVLFIVAIATRP